ncbi:ATP-binding protein [Streptomyces sp. NPDC051569]|uniref:ATP-binding protein n=1 Tax=Streptomyces sp. NPDC051569 TaxID=3365661 RepID=UPI0037B2B215
MYVIAEEHDQEPQPQPPAPGYYVRRRSRGFAAHINASGPHLRSVRELIAKVLAELGVDADAADSAQLVVSELVGNAVRAVGDHVPVVVEVYATSFGVAVNVHDPDPLALPRRRGIALDDAVAESGRGLALLDVVAPGWHVIRSAIGKQVRCRVPEDRPCG